MTDGTGSSSSERPVDWTGLSAVASHAASLSYAPYSGFAVGAAGLADNGRIVSGCNVENASYGLTLCAECGMVSALHASGGGRLIAVVCVGSRPPAPPAPVMPCGRCRQLLHEAGGDDLLVDGDGTPRRLAELLPSAFGPRAVSPGEA
jgi:cytidine deaminase